LRKAPNFWRQPFLRGLAPPPVEVARVSVTELSQRLGKHPGATSKNVKAAIRDGYLEDRSPGQGRTSALVIGERKLPEQKILPDPKELFGKFGEPQLMPLQEKLNAGPPGNPERHAVA
jgi:hypothetical protein